jgi:nucleoside-diphosphate-sugar epimerase
MRVFVLGATGVIGRRALPALVAAGHEVSALARNRGGAGRVTALGAEPVEADPFDETSLARALAGHEAVVNVMTRIPPLSRAALPSAWRENDRLRREASGTVARAARTAGARRLVQESIGFLYADGGDAWLDEDAPIEPAGQTRSAVDAERNARSFGDAVVLRFGSFYGLDSDQSAAMVAMARRGLSPLPIRPAGYVSPLWLDDTGTAVAAALAAPAGTYNVADAEPLRGAEFDAALAAAVGRRRLRAPARPIMRLAPTLRVVARSQRLASDRLREATGWSSSMPSSRDGIVELVRALETRRAEGGADAAARG